MVAIKDIKTKLVPIMFTHPFEISREVMKKEQRRVFVRIESEDGSFGYGEASHLPSFTGEEAVSIQKVIDELLSPSIVGENIENFRKILFKLENAIPANHTAKNALEMALWDLYGKSLDLPVHRLLGGKYRDKVDLAYVLSLKDPEIMANEAENALKKGYKTIKTKLTGNVKKDEKILSKVRETIGHEIKLRADVNAGYKGKDGMEAAKRFEKFNLEYLEQPSSPHDFDMLKDIRDNSTIPIGADESILSKGNALELIRNRVVDHFVIKLIKVGGILPALHIANMADIAGINCTIVSPFETSLGSAAGLQIAAVAPNAVVAHELFEPTEYLEEDYAKGLNFMGAILPVEDKPGLGVELKKEKVDF